MMRITPTLHIDLDAIAANYRALSDGFSGAQMSAVVKADAYGCGAEAVARVLQKAGCKRFFVATLDEAIALRETLVEEEIAVFHGVQKGEAETFLAHKLTPVLNSTLQMERWAETANGAPAMLHLDTAMGRLGLTEAEYKYIREERADLLAACNLTTLMTHLCNASEPIHGINEEQRARFAALTMHTPELERSFCNSGGIGLGEEYHCDLARPGCALYGIKPHSDFPITLQSVARWEAPILQTRTLDRDQSIGYGCTVVRPKGARLATVASGYADGVLRNLSNNLYGLCAGVKLPLIGRVTMDMLVFDVSDVPEQIMEQTESITLMWDEQDVNVIADAADTIGYEVLTRIGMRVKRVYSGASA